jgi:hypothetical protein
MPSISGFGDRPVDQTNRPKGTAEGGRRAKQKALERNCPRRETDIDNLKVILPFPSSLISRLPLFTLVTVCLLLIVLL